MAKQNRKNVVANVVAAGVTEGETFKLTEATEPTTTNDTVTVATEPTDTTIATTGLREMFDTIMAKPVTVTPPTETTLSPTADRFTHSIQMSRWIEGKAHYIANDGTVHKSLVHVRRHQGDAKNIDDDGIVKWLSMMTKTFNQDGKVIPKLWLQVIDKNGNTVELGSLNVGDVAERVYCGRFILNELTTKKGQSVEVFPDGVDGIPGSVEVWLERETLYYDGDKLIALKK